jgi:class 3 adenylate cyclase
MSSKPPRSNDERIDAPHRLSEDEREKGRRNKQADLNAYLRLVEKLSPGTLARMLTRNANEVAEAMLAEDDAALRAAAMPRKPERPATSRKHLWIMGTVEAYIGAGLIQPFGVAPLRSSSAVRGCWIIKPGAHCRYAEIKLVIAGNYVECSSNARPSKEDPQGHSGAAH